MPRTVRTTRRAARHGVALGAALATLSAAAARAGAAGPVAHDERPPAGDAATLVDGADARGDGRLRVAAALVHLARPVVLVAPTQRIDRVVESRTEWHAGASLALDDRWLGWADVALETTRPGEGVPPGAGLEPARGGTHAGDATLGVRGRLFGDPRSLAVALRGSLTLPTGSRASYASSGRTRGAAGVTVGAASVTTAWGAELRYDARPSFVVAGVEPYRTGDSLRAGVAWQRTADASARWFVGPELRGSTVVADGARWMDPQSSSVDAVVTLRWLVPGPPVVLSASAGPSVGRWVGTPSFRVVLVAAWSPEGTPPPVDRDEDAIPDAVDACVDLPGERAADPLMHGCPPPPADRDGDAIADARDACPDAAGEPARDRRRHGCPAPPPGAAPPPPPPPPAPRPPPAQLVDRRIVIGERVEFERDSAVLLPASEPVLAAVARVLEEHAEIERLTVEGHTDDTGSPAHNLELSLARARAVVAWLAAHGVAAERLVAAGRGAERPLARGDAEADRQRNRRVEFRVARLRGAAEAPPP
ncbi:MAG: OmpA family protein [Polyangiaceae bacterium]|nr:OmpA family protein [Polyangiaceae bacterium]